MQDAVVLQDQLPYTEPPPWYFPNREALGYALLRSGRPAQAEAVYRKQLDYTPRNGWSLLGLVQWWLEQGCPHPAEEMTRMLRQLFNLGRLQVMGLIRPDLEPAQGAPRPGQPPA